MSKILYYVGIVLLIIALIIFITGLCISIILAIIPFYIGYFFINRAYKVVINKDVDKSSGNC